MAWAGSSATSRRRSPSPLDTATVETIRKTCWTVPSESVSWQSRKLQVERVWDLKSEVVRRPFLRPRSTAAPMR